MEGLGQKSDLIMRLRYDILFQVTMADIVGVFGQPGDGADDDLIHDDRHDNSHDNDQRGQSG